MEARKEVSLDIIGRSTWSEQADGKSIAQSFGVLVLLVALAAAAVLFGPVALQRPGVLYQGVDGDGEPYCYARVEISSPVVPCTDIDPAILEALRTRSLPVHPGGFVVSPVNIAP